MLSTLQRNALTALGALALLLAMANAVLFTQNRSTQAELSVNQQFVQQTGPLETLYRELVKALAELAVKGNDRQVLDMLAAQGLSVTVNAATAGAPEPLARKADK